MMNFKNLFTLVTALGLVLVACKPAQPLATIDRKVDLNRYAGKWYEIAKLPTRFQRGCGCATATYTLLPDGKIEVLNQCIKNDGKLKDIKGTARTTNELGDKLEVSFFPLIWGKYWILDLDENYQTVMVGHPNREYLWILNRAPKLEETTYQRLIAKAKAAGFNTNQVTRSRTACAE